MHTTKPTLRTLDDFVAAAELIIQVLRRQGQPVSLRLVAWLLPEFFDIKIPSATAQRGAKTRA